MDNIYDLIIIGAGSAGLTAGIYSGRAKLNTLILDKDAPGGQVSTTAEVVNYPGVYHTSGPDLMDEMKKQALHFGVVFANAEVTDMDFSDTVKILHTSRGTYKCYAVIIATGASPRALGFKGEKEFAGRGVAYCSTCDGELFEGLDVFVIGAGYAAAEEAMYLTRFAKHVTIIAREPEFTCAKSIADRVLSDPNITVRFHTEIVEAKGDTHLESAIFVNNQTGETFTYTPEPEDRTFGIFVFIGYKPNTSVFKNHIPLNPEGYLPTDEVMSTEIPGVYAAGDLRPKFLRQIVTAVSDGAIASSHAEKYITELKEKLGIKSHFAPPKQVHVEKEKDKEVVQTSSKPRASSLLSEDIQKQLTSVFSKLERKVTLASVVDPNLPKSLELKNFILDIASLSSLIDTKIVLKGEDESFEHKIHADKYPVVTLLDHTGAYTGVKFHGIPGGHELNSFVLAVYNLAGPGQPLDETTIKRIQRVDKPTHIKVAVSLSCHLCPDVVVAAQRLALLNPLIEAEMLDISLFKDLKTKHNIMSVPAIMIDEKPIVFGPKKIDDILSLIIQ